MSSFLAQLAEKIAANSEVPLENTIIVVPNKRAQRKLLRELALHYTKPVFAPNILSVNEFIESLSSLKKIDNNELLMRLFDIYKKKDPEKNDDFAAFLAWAPLFLSDINEIDLNLADANAAFTNLSKIKELDTLFGKENITEAQRKYLSFFNRLADLYAAFTSSLLAESVGYEGLIYKDVADLLLSQSHFRYVFAGLNAATPAELKILHQFYLQNNTEFYFDIDNFYAHDYGIFIDEIHKKLKIPEIHKSNDYRDISKDIYYIGAPKRTAQIYKAIEKLNEIEQKQGNLNDTVLVLADETMLLPFIHAYNTEKANITMGYPLNATFAAQQLLQLIDDEKQNNRQQKPVYHLKTQGFEFLQYLKINLQNFENEQTNIENKEPYQFLTTLVAEVVTFLEKFFAGVTKLDFVIVEHFIKEKLNKSTIPFSGNAHEGLQIMGLLETRMLDFKNVVVLSLNEGILPKGKAVSSMLLYSIRKYFGLPSQQEKDKISGYHFFRLLQRAERVYLIYDNESQNALAEKSRFIGQLEFEVKNQNLQQSVKLHPQTFVPPFRLPAAETKISIAKTPIVIEKLTGFKYSPSSLNTYIQCPLHFYLRYIEKITVPEQFDHANESAVIGTVIHEVLKEIFTQLQQKPAQFADILSYFEKNIEDILHCVFHARPEIGDADITQGKLFLACQVAQKSILDYIKVVQKEWENAPFQIIATEIPLIAKVEVGEQTMNLTGMADRIEMRENKVTILDYKTGKVEAKKLQCIEEDIAVIFSTTDYPQLFQLLCYAYLYQNSDHPSLVSTQEFQCGIIAFQELYKESEQYICYAQIDKNKVLTDKILLLFEEHLKQLFYSILDEKTPFCQTADVENCKYCDYNGICNL